MGVRLLGLDQPAGGDIPERQPGRFRMSGEGMTDDEELSPGREKELFSSREAGFLERWQLAAGRDVPEADSRILVFCGKSRPVGGKNHVGELPRAGLKGCDGLFAVNIPDEGAIGASVLQRQ